MDPSSSAAKAKLAELNSATSDYEKSLGNVIDKQLSMGKATQAIETIVKSTGVSYTTAAAAVKQAAEAHGGLTTAVNAATPAVNAIAVASKAATIEHAAHG